MAAPTMNIGKMRLAAEAHKARHPGFDLERFMRWVVDQKGYTYNIAKMNRRLHFHRSAAIMDTDCSYTWRYDVKRKEKPGNEGRF